jgi:hypothetical protein
MQWTMVWSLSLVVVLRPLLGSLALAVGQPSAELATAPDEVGTARQGAPQALTVPPSTVRSECFEVQRADDPDAGPIAVVRLVRLDAADHTLLERDIVWRAEGWRVHQTERLAGRTRRVSWREQGPGDALAWTADWDLQDGSGGRMATIVSHGWARPTHERAQGGAPWIGALEWLEAARAGALAELGPVAWLTTARAPSGIAHHAGGAADPVGPEGRATFTDGALTCFELGSSELSATPIPEAEYQRLAGLWTWRRAARHPFVEAALRRDETLRRLAELGSSALYTRE